VQKTEDQAHQVVKNGGAPPPHKEFPVVLNSIYNSDLPPAEKTHERLFQDAFALVSAGTETTGTTLITITYHLLSSPQHLKLLQDELRTHFPTHTANSEVISYRALEKLPYLTACINEGLRLASGVCGRLPRVNRHGPTQYADYTIPAGTAMGMSIRDIHYDPSIFPDPTTFKPERWLDNDDSNDQNAKYSPRQLRERFLVPFGKGARNCAGSALAIAEMYAVVGNLFRRFCCGGEEEGKEEQPGMRLWESGREDVEMVMDLFAPVVSFDREGLRVMLE
jgi:cytochrome P450